MYQKHSKKKHSLRQLFTIFAVLTLLLCCAGCSKKTPREALEDAYKKTFVDNNPAESVLGLSELNSKLNDAQAYSTGFSLTLQELSGDGLEEYSGILSGLGLSVDSASDLLNRKSAGTMDITYGGTTYLTLGGQLQGSKVFITSPQLLDGSISVDCSTLKEDLASDSLLAQAFRESGLSLPEDVFGDLMNSFTAPSSLKDFVQLTTACKELSDSILVEQADKKSVSLPEGVTAKKVYNVTVPKHAYVAVLNAALQSMEDYSATLLNSLGEDATVTDSDLLEAKVAVQELADLIGDIVITVAVTKDGYINYAESTVKTETETYTLTAAFTGEESPACETTIKFDAEIAGETVNAQYKESFDTADNEIEFSFDVSANEKNMMKFAGEGTFTDIVKGQKYTLDFDYIEFEMEDTLSVTLACDYYADTTKCEISAPAGTEYNLFRMSQDDFTALVMEVMKNLQEDPLLSGLLGSMDLGISE